MLRKSFLGPALPATCTACGKKIGVPYTSAFVSLLILLPGIGVFAIDPTALKFSIALSCLAASIFVHLRWIPLEARVGGDRPSLEEIAREDIGESGDPEADSPEA